MRLITIPISHYCERARWALDRAGVAYREEQHLQCFHWPHALLAGRSKTVPVLVTAAHTLCDSADIVRFADAHAADAAGRLYRDDGTRPEVEALERDLADGLGVATRHLMYYHFFNWGRQALAFNDGFAPAWERAAIRALYRPLSRMLQHYLGIEEAGLDTVRGEITRAFDVVAERLADARPFLFGERFGAADLTFACMAGVVLAPREYGMPLPRVDEFPAAAQADIERYRAHPAGGFALRMFAEQRRAPT